MDKFIQLKNQIDLAPHTTGNYLITATLLDAWKYLLTSEYSSMEDFMKVLQREETPTTEAQQNGFEFETWAENNIAETKNGQYQVKLSRELKSRFGTPFLVYGRLDCLKQGKVYDYKFTSSYEVGKFFNRCQTSVYLFLVPEASEMKYIIGTKKSKYQLAENEEKGYNIYSESYKREEVKPIEEIINQFEEWLKTMDLWKVYIEKWQSK